MQIRNMIHIVGCHAEGEVGDVIVGGVAPPPGDTIWEQSRWIARDDRLRQLVLNEPRGGIFRHVNLLVPPKRPEADAAFIVMEPEDTPPMSGSNAICVATLILETGLVPMVKPETTLVLEAPGGLVRVTARSDGGKVRSVRLRNVPSFACALDRSLDVPGLGRLKVDTAFGGDSFVLVDADSLGFELVAREARELAELGARISAAATEQLGFTHPENPDWTHLSFCLFSSPAERRGDVLETRHAIAPGECLRARSIIDSSFTGRIEGETTVGDRAAIMPILEGRAWRTGDRRIFVDPDDPWPLGYRIPDTWPDA